MNNTEGGTRILENSWLLDVRLESSHFCSLLNQAQFVYNQCVRDGDRPEEYWQVETGCASAGYAGVANAHEDNLACRDHKKLPPKLVFSPSQPLALTRVEAIRHRESQWDGMNYDQRRTLWRQWTESGPVEHLDGDNTMFASTVNSFKGEQNSNTKECGQRDDKCVNPVK
jgi:hypothetical protein